MSRVPSHLRMALTSMGLMLCTECHTQGLRLPEARIFETGAGDEGRARIFETGAGDEGRARIFETGAGEAGVCRVL